MNVRLILVTLLYLALLSSVALGSETYKIDPVRSSISFKVRHFLGTAKGKFTKFTGTIEVDRDQPEKSSVTVSIHATSIDTAIAKRDEHLRSPDFFNVEKFPEITFKSKQVKKTGSKAGEIMGDLTMHGVTRPITLQVELVGTPESIGQDPTTRWRVTVAPIKRSQFGLGWSKGVEAVSMIGDDVTVDIQIEATQAK